MRIFILIWKVFLIFVGLIICLIIYFVVDAVVDWGFLRDEITQYPVLCKEKIYLGRCKNIEYTLNPTTYKVNKEKQEVLLYTPPLSSLMQKLTNCVVWDRKNWRCSFIDNSAEFGFSNGRFWEYVTPFNMDLVKDQGERTYYVSRYAWIKIKIFH